jgi:hypothetical protein
MSDTNKRHKVGGQSKRPATPKALPVLDKAIPRELRQLNRWVVWRYVQDVDPETGDVDFDKPPVNARTGGLASSTNKATWSTFFEALAAYCKGDLDGMGFVLNGENDLVAVDLDKCRDPVSGAIEPWGRDIVQALDTYTEVSPSGEGLRLFLHGKLPPHGRKKGAYENYSTGRYVTVTGHRLDGTPAEIGDRQDELDRVHRRIFGETPKPPKRRPVGAGDVADDEIICKASAAKNGGRFRRLWDGYHDFPSASEADLALCRRLAFWCGPYPERIDALFRQSGLFRSKWNRQDYRERTIRKALEGCNEFYTWGQDRHKDRHHATATPPQCHSEAEKPPKPTATVKVPRRRLEPYQPFPVGALPLPLRAYVEQGALALGCDPGYLALPALAVAASLIGNSRTIRLRRDWSEPCVVWSAIVGDSGTLKSPALKLVMSPVHRIQRELLARFDAECDAWEREKEDYERRAAAARKEKKTLDTRPPEKPTPVRLVTGDVTIEKVIHLLHDNPRGMLVCRDELGGWLMSFTRYKGKSGGTDLPCWLEMWRGDTIIYDRKSGEPPTLLVPHAAICVTGSVQPGTLARALLPEHFEAGLPARLLLAMPPKRRKEWTEAEVDPDTREIYEGTLRQLQALKMDTDDRGDREPFAVKLTPQAREAWIAFYKQWATVQEVADGELAAAYSKLEGYAARLALVHHVVSRVAESEDSDPVEAVSIEAGATLARWFAHEARRIYSALRESDAERDIRRLVEFIRARGGKVTLRELQRSNSAKYPEADDAEKALKALEDAELGRWVEGPVPARGGHRPRFFELNPTHDTCDTRLGGEADDPDEAPDTRDATCVFPEENKRVSQVSCVGEDQGQQDKAPPKQGGEDRASGPSVGPGDDTPPDAGEGYTPGYNPNF